MFAGATKILIVLLLLWMEETNKSNLYIRARFQSIERCTKNRPDEFDRLILSFLEKIV